MLDDMSDTAAPAYPVEACNENGPYPQDVAIRWQSYEGSANPPDEGGGGETAATFDIGIGGMHAWCATADATTGDVFNVIWGDGTAAVSMTADVNGACSVSHDYAAGGTYTVVVRDAGGTDVATQSLTATALP